MPLFAYFRHCRSEYIEREKRFNEYRTTIPFKKQIQTEWENWKNSSFIEKFIFILLSPIYLLMLLLFIPVALLTILFSPILLLILVGGFFIYTIPSILIGGSIDLLRQISVRKKDVWFEKWKYTDKMLSWWELAPYGMSVQGYLDFKQKTL